MASGNQILAPSEELNSAPSTKNDLLLLKEELLQAIKTTVTEVIQPLQTQLNELVKDLHDTSKIAENTAEIALTLQDDVKSLRSTDVQLNTRLTALENRWRMPNLKFRGIEEGMEEANIRFRWSPTSDLHVYRNGLLHQASDNGSGKALLTSLGLKLTDEEEQALLDT
ncbi:UNVERIFIED_CONTAM: hypothetical protein K2H54_056457 [Gekko kuhli]